MNSLPDPTFFLHLSETFIKTARLDCGEGKPRFGSLREVSSVELTSQPNPLLQIAGEVKVSPVPVETTLSLGETTYHCESFDQIGFSTLSEYITRDNSAKLRDFELGVFSQSNGLPAPTASPEPLDLVFCGFNSNVIPEISDAFPNLDAEPLSITLAVLDLFRFIKSQCKEGEQVLLIEIANDKTHLFLIGSEGLIGIQAMDMGRQKLYETMAEVLHLHYIGSAIKLFTRSGFDSSEIAPRLGELFGEAIQTTLSENNWAPSRAHLTGLMHAQSWFQASIFKKLRIEPFNVDRTELPFEIDSSVGDLSSMDSEILAKVFTRLTRDQDHSWNIDYIGSLGKSKTIPRREITSSIPPFPTAHPNRTPEPVAVSLEPKPTLAEVRPVVEEAIPYAPQPPVSESQAEQQVIEEPVSEEPPEDPKEIEAIPAHILSDIEEYEGEFEDVDDYGGGTGRMIIKIGMLIVSVAIVSVIVTVVFFPKASERYLGIRPPHIDFEERNPNSVNTGPAGNSSAYSSGVELTETDVALGIQDLRDKREDKSFGGLFLPTNPSGATVIIGDMNPQLSPVKLPNVEPGTYEIIISKDGYKTQSLTVTIAPKQVLITETVNLERLP